MRKFSLYIILSIICFSLGYGQGMYSTKGAFNKKLTSYSLGFLSTTLDLPEYKQNNVVLFKANETVHSGVLFTYTYDVAELAASNLSSKDQLTFDFDGNFRIGVGFGEIKIPAQFAGGTEYKEKTYAGVLDVFSLDFTPKYTHVFSPTFAMTGKFAVNFFNLGASFIIGENSNLENSYAVASIIPLSLKPSVQFDFGKGALGIALYFNPWSVLGYSYTPKDAFNNEYREFGSKSLVKKFAVEIFYTH